MRQGWGERGVRAWACGGTVQFSQQAGSTTEPIISEQSSYATLAAPGFVPMTALNQSYGDLLQAFRTGKSAYAVAQRLAADPDAIRRQSAAGTRRRSLRDQRGSAPRHHRARHRHRRADRGSHRHPRDANAHRHCPRHGNCDEHRNAYCNANHHSPAHRRCTQRSHTAHIADAPDYDRLHQRPIPRLPTIRTSQQHWQHHHSHWLQQRALNLLHPLCSCAMTPGATRAGRHASHLRSSPAINPHLWIICGAVVCGLPIIAVRFR